MNLGTHHTEETKKRLSEASKGRVMSDKARASIRLALLGRPCSAETRKKIGDAQKKEKHHMWGKHLTEETKKKLSAINKGKLFSEVTRRRISESKKGKPRPDMVGNKIMVGRKLSTETRLKIAKSSARGELNNMWKGGITPINQQIRTSSQYFLWRDGIYARDNWTCQKCKVRGGFLHAHHILNFSDYKESRFDFSNGITLHKKCHDRFHNIYGRSNNTREQLEEYLSTVDSLVPTML